MLSKAVYVPMMALGFLIPSSKFKNKEQRRIFRIVNVVCIVGILATFMLPMLIATESLGDTRGGDISVGGQLALILEHPVGYLKVWMKNVAGTLFHYYLGFICYCAEKILRTI